MLITGTYFAAKLGVLATSEYSAGEARQYESLEAAPHGTCADGIRTRMRSLYSAR